VRFWLGGGRCPGLAQRTIRRAADVCAADPKSGRTPDDVLRYLGLSVEDIVKTAVDLPVASR
jgi:hypothetical protein